MRSGQNKIQYGSFVYIELLVVLEDIQLITHCVILYSTLVLVTFSV